MTNTTKDTLIRISLFIPLVIITMQIVLLSRILSSFAWRILALGFVVFMILVGASLIMDVPNYTRLGLSFFGYLCIAGGFFVFRRDLKNLENRE